MKYFSRALLLNPKCNIKFMTALCYSAKISILVLDSSQYNLHYSGIVIESIMCKFEANDCQSSVLI